MPNWCSNDITVIARSGELAQMQKHCAASDSADSPAGCFSFQSIIPLEEESETWRDDRVSAWGTKWDVTGSVEASTHDLGDGLAAWRIYFDTAWGPSLPVTSELSRVFPQAWFIHQCWEYGAYFGGTVILHQNGSVAEINHEELHPHTRGIEAEVIVATTHSVLEDAHIRERAENSEEQVEEYLAGKFRRTATLLVDTVNDSVLAYPASEAGEVHQILNSPQAQEYLTDWLVDTQSVNEAFSGFLKDPQYSSSAARLAALTVAGVSHALTWEQPGEIADPNNMRQYEEIDELVDYEPWLRAWETMLATGTSPETLVALVNKVVHNNTEPVAVSAAVVDALGR